MSSNMLCTLFLTFCTLASLNANGIEPRKGTSYVDKETLSEMERKRAEPKISQEFSRGKFLIYDCKNRNFACVNESSYGLCKAKRERGFRNKKQVLPCAPLKEFETQKDCFAKQYKLIHQQSEKSYCQNSKNSKY